MTLSLKPSAVLFSAMAFATSPAAAEEFVFDTERHQQISAELLSTTQSIADILAANNLGHCAYRAEVLRLSSESTFSPTLERPRSRTASISMGPGCPEAKGKESLILSIAQEMAQLYIAIEELVGTEICYAASLQRTAEQINAEMPATRNHHPVECGTKSILEGDVVERT